MPLNLSHISLLTQNYVQKDRPYKNAPAVLGGGMRAMAMCVARHQQLQMSGNRQKLHALAGGPNTSDKETPAFL